VPGHWKGDLIPGAKNSHVATLVERQSRFVMLVQVDGKDSGTVVDALVGQIRRLPDELMASLTWDRGTGMAHHARLTAVVVSRYARCRRTSGPCPAVSSSDTDIGRAGAPTD